ncbi:M13 family peptidase, partial [Ornithobacterium rhinotracheale]
FDFGVGALPKNSNQIAVYLGSGNLGMNRDYYQKKDKESQSKLEASREYLVDFFKYMNDPTTEYYATAVLDFEKEIASNL